MVIECALFCAGVIVQVCSFHVWQQVAVGRLISGIAVGGLSAAVPMVLSTILYAILSLNDRSSIKQRQHRPKFVVQ